MKSMFCVYIMQIVNSIYDLHRSSVLAIRAIAQSAHSGAVAVGLQRRALQHDAQEVAVLLGVVVGIGLVQY